MLDQPTHYTLDEGGDWLPYPFEVFPVSNPAVMTLSGRDHAIFRSARYPGASLMVHALKWADGARWDALNGVTAGKFPR